MNKALLGLLVLSALLVSQTLAADVECKNHPAFVKARQFIKDAVKDIAKGGEKSENLLKAFESATPETLSAEDLGVCAQFANQKTCCNKNIVKLLDRAAFIRTGALNKRNSAIKKAVNVAFKILKRKNCPKA